VRTPLLLAATALLTLAACVSKDDAAKPVQTPPVFAGVPIPALARMIDTAGTADAARAVFLVAVRPESVVAYYRRELPRVGFRIVGDVGDSLRVDLYAQREGPSLWVQIRPLREPDATEFTLIGAVGPQARQGHPLTGDSARRGARR
jgi:hypothetical protein